MLTDEEALNNADKEAEEDLCKMLRSLSEEELTSLPEECVVWLSTAEGQETFDELDGGIRTNTDLLSEEGGGK